MKKYVLLTVAFVFVLTTSAFANNMVKPDVFKQWMESSKKMMIVDIQVPAEFEKHHFKGSIKTNAFPVKSDADKKKLGVVVEKAKASNDGIVIICPRGRSGAVNTYEYLKSKGIAESRLYILEGGIEKWPYRDMLQSGR